MRLAKISALPSKAAWPPVSTGAEPRTLANSRGQPCCLNAEEVQNFFSYFVRMRQCVDIGFEQQAGESSLSKTGIAQDVTRHRFCTAELRGLFDDEQRSCEEEFRSKDAEYVRSRFCEPEDETACCAKSYVTYAGIIEQQVPSRGRDYCPNAAPR